ncbi:MAG: phosphoribosyltransferase [Candidatus Kerfeldbacteria bacterium]|nr:phosphoribosyltransferase [Candidatus Kerfeldbacteria bacterium]
MSDKYMILDVPGLDRDGASEQGERCRDFMRRLQDLGITPMTASSLTELTILSWRDRFGEVARDQSTLLVFPGNGANVVRGYLPQEWLERCKWRAVEAKRIWEPGQPPRAIVGRISPQRLGSMRCVIIVDDVISSGATIREIMHVNDPWIPNAKWYAFSWIRQTSAFTKRFDGVYSAWEPVGTNTMKVPINSLSTLLAHPELADSYARRNFADPAPLLTLLGEAGKDK